MRLQRWKLMNCSGKWMQSIPKTLYAYGTKSIFEGNTSQRILKNEIEPI